MKQVCSLCNGLVLIDSKEFWDGVELMTKNNRWIWVILLFLQIACILFLMDQREYLFTDEVYSYGLSNSEDYSFIHLNEHIWYSGDYFENYIKYDGSKPFSLDAAYRNQSNDVHPPLYYYLLHFTCSFFPEYSYSVVPGIVLNLFLLLFVDACFCYIAGLFFKDETKITAGFLLWGASAAFFSNVIFVRMYFMETLMILLFICVHIYFYRNYKSFSIYQAMVYAMMVMLGGLTHYYFYFFAAAFGGCLCLAMLLSRRIKLLIAYGFSLVAGVVMAFMAFPATWNHIFGYRGSYATDNLIGFSSDKFVQYYRWFNDSLLAGCGGILLLAFCVAVLWYLVRNICDVSISLESGANNCHVHWKINKNIKFKSDGEFVIEARHWIMLSSIIANAILAFVSVQGSEIVHHRYIYPIYPVFSLCIVGILAWCFKQLGIKCVRSLLCMVCLLLSIGSIKAYGIDWMYEDYEWKTDFVKDMQNQDFIVVGRRSYWLNYYSGLNVYRNADEIAYVSDDNIVDIDLLLLQRKTKDSVFVSFPRNGYEYTEQERDEILNLICEQCGFVSYYLKYDHDTYMYEMLGQKMARIDQ